MALQECYASAQRQLAQGVYGAAPRIRAASKLHQYLGYAPPLQGDLCELFPAEAAGDPVLLKVAPDLSLNELDDVVHIARSRRVDGMIVANTTLARPSTLRESNRAKEQGGLSGRPLFRLSTRMVAETYVRAEGAFPLIGVGGIDSGGAALTKIRAGASLIQLYSSLVYKGLSLVDDIKRDLASTLLRTGRDQLSEIVGADAATITAEDWPV